MIPQNALTGVNDFDMVPMGLPREFIRECSCGQVMKIEIENNEEDTLKGIACKEGCFLRGGSTAHKPTEFGLGNDASTFLYCSKCQHRRSWHLFKEK